MDDKLEQLFKKQDEINCALREAHAALRIGLDRERYQELYQIIRLIRKNKYEPNSPIMLLLQEVLKFVDTFPIEALRLEPSPEMDILSSPYFIQRFTKDPEFQKTVLLSMDNKISEFGRFKEYCISNYDNWAKESLAKIRLCIEENGLNISLISSKNLDSASLGFFDLDFEAYADSNRNEDDTLRSGAGAR